MKLFLGFVDKDVKNKGIFLYGIALAALRMPEPTLIGRWHIDQDGRNLAKCITFETIADAIIMRIGCAHGKDAQRRGLYLTIAVDKVDGVGIGCGCHCQHIGHRHDRRWCRATWPLVGHKVRQLESDIG